jgi:hypothetical protein
VGGWGLGVRVWGFGVRGLGFGVQDDVHHLLHVAYRVSRWVG